MGVTHGETLAQFPTIVGVAASPLPPALSTLSSCLSSHHVMSWSGPQGAVPLQLPIAARHARALLSPLITHAGLFVPGPGVREMI